MREEKTSNVHEKDILEVLLNSNPIHFSLWKQSAHDKSTFISVSSDMTTALNRTVNELVNSTVKELLFPSIIFSKAWICIHMYMDNNMYTFYFAD